MQDIINRLLNEGCSCGWESKDGCLGCTAAREIRRLREANRSANEELLRLMKRKDSSV